MRFDSIYYFLLNFTVKSTAEQPTRKGFVRGVLSDCPGIRPQNFMATNTEPWIPVPPWRNPSAKNMSNKMF